MRQFLFLARSDDAAWQAPRKEERRGQGQNSGYFFENHPGYNIDMPGIYAGGLRGLKKRGSLMGKLYRYSIMPLVAARQLGRVALNATPLRYLGLVAGGLVQQAGRFISYLTGRREPRNWASENVENFFVYNANNQQISYSTVNHNFNQDFIDSGSTEYLSTTIEFFSRPTHA